MGQTLNETQKAKLRELALGATPGPWIDIWGNPNPDQYSKNEVAILAPNEAEGYDQYVVGALWYDGLHTACTVENSAFIAAANPSIVLNLLDELDANRPDAPPRWRPLTDGKPALERLVLVTQELEPVNLRPSFGHLKRDDSGEYFWRVDRLDYCFQNYSHWCYTPTFNR